MRNYILLFVFLLSTVAISFSQRACGADEILKNNLDKNPEKELVRQQLENFTKEFIETHGQTRKMDEEYIIPVVVHVIHNYGEANISDAQVASGIQTLNNDFNAENDDIVDVIEEFQGIIGDIGISFRLATIDPDGNCTYGITRTASPLTEGQDGAVHTLISWPEENYVNIYVIKEMAVRGPGQVQPAAYANYPGSGDPFDKIVCLHNYFGFGEGTAPSSNYVRHTMPHEFGHFFNLAHPWGGGMCGEIENCGGDDDVEDTPNTIGICGGGCGDNVLYQESCGSLDNTQNIMDYGNCAHMFTEGQKARVHAALNSISGDRENLWQPENLILTGVDNNHFNSIETYESCAPIPDFATTTNTGCQGVPIQFFANHPFDEDNPNLPGVMTYNSDQIYYYWDFGLGAVPQTSYDANPSVTYIEKGSHSVSLTVCNGSITDENSFCNELTRENYIYILDDVVVSNEDGISQNFAPSESGVFPENDGWYIMPQLEEETWTTTTSASWNDNTSVRIRSRYFGYQLNSHTFTTPELDLSGLSSAQLYFNMAYALKSNQTDFDGNLYIQDKLIIYTSEDCGETWMARKTYDVEDLITVFDQNGNPLTIFSDFVPEGNSVNPGGWTEKDFSLNNVASSTGVIVKFEFIGVGLDEDGVNVGGNWLYIDNVRLGDNFVGLEEEQNIDLNIFPNPSGGTANIELILKSSGKASIELYNILGKSLAIKSFDLNKGLNNIKLKDIYRDISIGTYIINVTMENKTRSSSIIIN